MKYIPTGHRLSSAVTMSTPWNKLSRNSSKFAEEGNRPDAPDMTTVSSFPILSLTLICMIFRSVLLEWTGNEYRNPLITEQEGSDIDPCFPDLQDLMWNMKQK